MHEPPEPADAASSWSAWRYLFNRMMESEYGRAPLSSVEYMAPAFEESLRVSSP